MTLREQVSELLKRIPDAGILLEIHEGREIALLTDYHLQALPENWNAPPPPDYVGGRILIPAFKDGDSYTIYCVEPATSQFFAIDIETPWPPQRVFTSCLDFKKYVFSIATTEKSEQVKSLLGMQLGITPTS